MDQVAENANLSSIVVDKFKAAMGAERVEEVEVDGKKIVVVDVQPVRLPYDHEVGATYNAEQTDYKRFFDTYRGLTNGGVRGANISSKGYTDIGEVRVVTSGNEVVYLIPKAEFAKLAGEPLHLKNEEINRLINKWVDKNIELGDENFLAGSALSGRDGAQLTAVMAGLKPVSVELSFVNNSGLEEFLATTGLRSFAFKNNKGGHGENRDKNVVFNPIAAQKIIDENIELFEKIGLDGKSVDEIVYSITGDYLNDSGRHDEPVNWDRIQAFGLLLGYDKTSCEGYRNNDIDWEKTFMPRDHAGSHAGSHAVNAVPFNFYGVDYLIEDPENNADFQALKGRYDALVKRVERLLEQGFSPADALRELEKDTPEVLEDLVEATGEAIDKVKILES